MMTSNLKDLKSRLSDTDCLLDELKDFLAIIKA